MSQAASSVVFCVVLWAALFAGPQALCAGEVDPPPPPSPPAPGAGDLDSLLEMDPESLSNVSVNKVEATLTDPVIETVSKTTEKASEAPGIVDVITARDIRDFGAKNLYEVLERATSVYMTGSYMHPQNQASIRGNLIKHQDNHVLILLNGRPVRDIVFGGVNSGIYTGFPLSAVERVEIVRGPGSVLYGTNAVTGVINIVTKTPTENSGQASTLQGSDGWQSYEVAGGDGGEDGHLFVATSYRGESGWPYSATLLNGSFNELMHQDNVGVFSSFAKGGFTAEAMVVNSDHQAIGGIPVGPGFDNNLDQVFADLGYFAEIGDHQSVQFDFTYNYQDFRSSFVPAPNTRLPIYGVSQSYLLESTYRANLTDKLDFMLGGIVDIHEGKQNAIAPFSEVWYGAYLQLDYRPVEWLKLVGGMQANMPGEIKSGIVPRAGAIVTLTERLTAKLLYGQAFRSPYQVERNVFVPSAIIGNPDLSPEVIQTFDAQLAYATEDFRLAATWFHSDFFGVVSRTSGLPQSYFHGSRIEYTGFELENDWRLSERLRWMGSLTYQENSRDAVDNYTGAPNWMAKMGLAYTDDCRGLTVGLFDTFYGDPTVPATAAIVNADPRAYHLVSLNSTVNFNKWMGWRRDRTVTGQFLIQNLLDENINHIEFEVDQLNSLPAGPGITFYGGLTLEY